MKRLIFIIWIFILFGTSCRHTSEQNAVRVPTSNENEVPVISYYIDRHIENPELANMETSVIFSLMKNGILIYSKNELGGPPYYKSNLIPAEVSSILNYFEDRGYFENPVCHIQHASIHDDLPTIVVLKDSKYIYMINSHVLWEQNYGDMVGTSRGVRSIKLQDPNSIAILRTEEYLEFRKNWDDIVSYLHACLPAEGKEVDVVFKQKSTNLRILSTDIDY